MSESEILVEDEDQQSETDQTEIQEEVQQVISVHPTPNRSLNAEDNNMSTVVAEFEMQKVQQ